MNISFPSLKNPHLWMIIILTSVLFFLYNYWPWRIWQLEDNILRQFSNSSFLYSLALFETNYRIIGCLFLIPILYATIVFRLLGASVFSVISLISVLPVIVNLWQSPAIWLTNIGVLLLPVAAVLIARIELELRRKDRMAIIRERQEYTSVMLEAQEKERQRIARELHDETIQTLVAIKKRAESVLSSEDNNDISWIRDTVFHTIDDLRRIILDLRPSVLDDVGLIPALRWLVDRAKKDYGINIQLYVDGTECILSPQSEITVFRIVQEALNNIGYHSKAKEATIKMIFDAKSLNITIQDDGQGIYQEGKRTAIQSKNRLGLIGIKERVESLGGVFQIYSKPGLGTELNIRMNIDTEEYN